MDKIITTIEKVSDIEIKRIKVTPEVVIPEKTEETVITLEAVEKELEVLNQQIVQAETAKAFDMKQYTDAEISHDARIAPLLEKRVVLEQEIQDAKDLGVTVKPVDVEPTPVEEVIL